MPLAHLRHHRYHKETVSQEVQISKHKKHGMNLQVIASPHGDVLRVSGALPGASTRQESRVGLGRPGRAGACGPGHPGR